MHKILTQSESSILNRVIAPRDGCLSIEVANSILGFGFSESDISRMNSLAAKNRLGEISADERDELESYSRVGNLLNLLQSKARRSIRNG